MINGEYSFCFFGVDKPAMKRKQQAILMFIISR